MERPRGSRMRALPVGALIVAAGFWPDHAPAAGKTLSELDAVYARGLKARDVPTVVAAAKVLARSVDDHPDHAGLVLNRVGMLYLRVGRARDARSAFQRAVGFDPQLATAHCGLGRVALELDGDPAGALPHLEAALRADSTYAWTHAYLARAHAQIGIERLKAGAADSARSALQRAVGFDPKLSQAHCGLGRLALEHEADPARALTHLEAAIDADSTHAEAHYLLARVYRETGRPGARHAADRALEFDSRIAPAHLLLAELHREEGNLQGAMVYFEKYLELKPADQAAALAFARELLEEEKFEEVETLTTLMTDDLALPLLAQALMARGDFEGTLRAFKIYIESLDPEEQALYRDVSLVGLPHEIEAWRATPPEKRAAFLQRFWLRHDPFKASRGAMRRAEHHRRVWYARTKYGTLKWPWDRRGEVYIRYGAPDYRSSSLQPNPKVPPAVERVQDNIAYQLYGAQGAGHQLRGACLSHPNRSGFLSGAQRGHSARLAGCCNRGARSGRVCTRSGRTGRRGQSRRVTAATDRSRRLSHRSRNRPGPRIRDRAERMEAGHDRAQLGVGALGGLGLCGRGKGAGSRLHG